MKENKTIGVSLIKRRVLLLFSVSLLVIALAGCGSGTTTKKDNSNVDSVRTTTSDNAPVVKAQINTKDLERTSDEGQVSFSVTFANPLGQEKKGYLSFNVVLDTHTVNLSASPLNKHIKLYDTKGNLVSDQAEWEPEGEGHHLIGKLLFQTKQDLQSIDGLKLVVEYFGEAAKREFTWDKEYLAF